MKPNLVLIVGNIATRYVNGKQTQKAEIDFSTGLRNVLLAIEDFRKNDKIEDNEPS